MTQDEIIRMAREAGGYLAELPNGDAWLFDDDQFLERFAALVAAHEREQVLANDDSLTLAYIVGIREGRLAEREACAKVADGELMNTNMLTSYPPKSSAAWNITAAIRARGM